ncbi:hypothetical protein B0H13DRAFT_1608008, partial [Mycena leptocephala]
FAVAVFHAFGHDWPCQCCYHPRKRRGFGFMNGEGCERFWHSISHLIAHLRVSSYHHRLYMLDTQVKHSDEVNLFHLADWNKRRGIHSAEKRAAAEEIIAECGVTVEVLEEQWEQQVKTQTKPAPRTYPTALLRDTVEIRKEQLAACLAASLEAIEAGDAQVELTKVEKQLGKKMCALGADEKKKLGSIKTTKYLELQMRCRSLKYRLRKRLRERKFELDRVEHSAQRQIASEKKLGSHTRSAIKKCEPGIAKLYKEYNKAYAAIAKLIKSKSALESAVAPEPIDEKKVWELDVDNSVWQDVGLDDDDEEPPLWLKDEGVRKGIPAMLDLARSKEEDLELAKECRAMQVWFTEEWEIVKVAMQRAGKCFFPAKSSAQADTRF